MDTATIIILVLLTVFIVYLIFFGSSLSPFSKLNDPTLEVTYPNAQVGNDQINLQDTQVEPSVQINDSRYKYYTLALIDPDTANGNYLHWLTVNIENSQGTALANYKPPAPPQGTGNHHYIFTLLGQKEKINELPEVNRSGFDLDKFLDQVGKDNFEKIGSIYFTAHH